MDLWKRLLLVPVAAAATTVGAAGVSAGAFDDPTVRFAEVTSLSPRVDVLLWGKPFPRGASVVLVESDVPIDRAKRFRLRFDPRAVPLNGEIDGRVVGRLAADSTYDVLAVDPKFGVPYFTIPRALTARAPKFDELATTSAAAGETVYVHVAFAPTKPRFAVNGVPARTVFDTDGEHFGFEMPAMRPGVSVAAVTAHVGASTLGAPKDLTVLAAPREFSAYFPDSKRSSTFETYEVADGKTSLTGRSVVAVGARYAHQEFFIQVPADVATLQLPAEFTEADGAIVSWRNVRRQGAWLPGPRGWFVRQTCSVRIESLEGGRLTGTFTAHLVHAAADDLVASGEPFDLNEGRFSIDPVEPGFARLDDQYAVY